MLHEPEGEKIIGIKLRALDIKKIFSFYQRDMQFIVVARLQHICTVQHMFSLLLWFNVIVR